MDIGAPKSGWKPCPAAVTYAHCASARALGGSTFLSLTEECRAEWVLRACKAAASATLRQAPYYLGIACRAWAYRACADAAPLQVQYSSNPTSQLRYIPCCSVSARRPYPSISTGAAVGSCCAAHGWPAHRLGPAAGAARLSGSTPGWAASQSSSAARSKLWPPLPYSTGSRMTLLLSVQNHQHHQSCCADARAACTADGCCCRSAASWPSLPLVAAVGDTGGA